MHAHPSLLSFKQKASIIACRCVHPSQQPCPRHATMATHARPLVKQWPEHKKNLFQNKAPFHAPRSLRGELRHMNHLARLMSWLARALWRQTKQWADPHLGDKSKKNSTLTHHLTPFFNSPLPCREQQPASQDNNDALFTSFLLPPSSSSCALIGTKTKRLRGR